MANIAVQIATVDPVRFESGHEYVNGKVSAELHPLDFGDGLVFLSGLPRR